MTDPVTASVSQSGQFYQLDPGTEGVELAESPALLAVAAPQKAHLFLDDQPLASVWRARESLALAQADFTNQIGFHRLKVVSGGRETAFDFSTVSAKATWQEIQTMAQVCVGHYLNYRRQFTYFSRMGAPRKVLLPEVQFGWLRERVPEIERLIADIIRRPAVEPRPRVVASVRATDVSVPGTIKLLHEQPGLLEARQDGPLHFAGESYWPSLVRVRVSERLPAEAEHGQIAAFLRTLIADMDDLAPQLADESREMLAGWRRKMVSLRRAPLLGHFRMHSPTMSRAAGQPTAIQLRDRRYARLRTLASEYSSEISATEDRRDTIRVNLRDAWEIYQTFVGHVVGNALGLQYFSSSRNLRSRSSDGASMMSGSLRLYFDCRPPGSRLRSWRDSSLRPAAERPDLVVLDSATSRVLVLDAKFKTEGVSGRAKPEDLFEMQGYLNSFGIGSGGIVYPGPAPTVRYVRGGGNQVCELPLRAGWLDVLGGVDALHEYVRQALAQLWSPIPAN